MARDFRQLVVWQLADELQTVTLELTRTERWARDFDLRDEALKTTSQMCRNIAEGFRRHSHRDFARFLEYCESSTAELRSLFDEAQKKGCASAPQLQPARTLCYRLERALRPFIRYLRNNPPPPWWD